MFFLDPTDPSPIEAQLVRTVRAAVEAGPLASSPVAAVAGLVLGALAQQRRVQEPSTPPAGDTPTAEAILSPAAG